MVSLQPSPAAAALESSLENGNFGTCLVVQWLRFCRASSAGGAGLIPGWWTRSPHSAAAKSLKNKNQLPTPRKKQRNANSQVPPTLWNQDLGKRVCLTCPDSDSDALVTPLKGGRYPEGLKLSKVIAWSLGQEEGEGWEGLVWTMQSDRLRTRLFSTAF